MPEGLSQIQGHRTFCHLQRSQSANCRTIEPDPQRADVAVSRLCQFSTVPRRLGRSDRELTTTRIIAAFACHPHWARFSMPKKYGEHFTGMTLANGATSGFDLKSAIKSASRRSRKRSRKGTCQTGRKRCHRGPETAPYFSRVQRQRI